MSIEPNRTLARLKRPLLYVMGPLYVVAGVLHFVAPKVYAQVVPPELPRPLDLVYLSGIAEVALGVGVLIPRTRRASAWGLVALLAAVFPANLHMAVRDVTVEGVPAWMRDPPDAALWARLPLQGVLALWAWWYTRPMPDEDGAP
ncbi:DoxX family protein [Halobaculum sp. EA56]|uniref:DoxX family protein n=1 Tax=Halobaculum sp. EA56 TaxID=3421648 RepID=UPI003EBF38BE